MAVCIKSSNPTIQDKCGCFKNLWIATPVIVCYSARRLSAEDRQAEYGSGANILYSQVSQLAPATEENPHSVLLRLWDLMRERNPSKNKNLLQILTRLLCLGSKKPMKNIELLIPYKLSK
ncbi:hypothetical protein [Undibacterium sp.]|uniref:hypothetical protein n=1 Tax=Undibacterium sp. TaxID=1914977 RepID=UPI0025E64E85|nr:hypothetical protein [Undibacterium sp.]